MKPHATKTTVPRMAVETGTAVKVLGENRIFAPHLPFLTTRVTLLDSSLNATFSFKFTVEGKVFLVRN